MQEHRWDGSVKLTDRANMLDFRKALAEAEAVSLHKPGSVVTTKSGVRYIVDGDGAWRRLPDEDTP